MKSDFFLVMSGGPILWLSVVPRLNLWVSTRRMVPFLSSDVVLRCCGLTEGKMCLRVDFPHANLPEKDSNN